MRTIFKYPLEVTDYQEIRISGHSPQILSVQFQGDQPCLWALVEPYAAVFTKIPIWIVGTGNPFPEELHELRHIATIQDPEKPLVWHIFTSSAAPSNDPPAEYRETEVP